MTGRDAGVPLNHDLHQPVLLSEVLDALGVQDGETIVDGTFGAGGYSQRILEAANCRVFGIDRDPEAMVRGAALMDAYPDRLALLQGRFSDMEALMAGEDAASVDGVVLDLGVSSPQLDDADRGFSFRFDGPLDMRMSSEGQSAADVVNNFSLDELTGIIREFGEERHARRVAQEIVATRDETPITRTLALAEMIADVMPKSRGPRAKGKGKRGPERIHPATRTFQALRIYVNDEIGELRRGLAAAERLLGVGGRLVVVSFHSLEDREVKRFLQARSGNAPRAHRHSPAAETADQAPSFELLFRGAVKPGDAETGANPRARSARLRAARRTAAPAWQMEDAA
jgi:16S rRNA (cytosine1402-N4)-methyltransferase